MFGEPRHLDLCVGDFKLSQVAFNGSVALGSGLLRGYQLCGLDSLAREEPAQVRMVRLARLLHAQENLLLHRIGGELSIW